MKLRQKTLAITALTLLFFILILYAASEGIVMQGFVKLEKRHAERDVKRAVTAIQDELSTMNDIAYDWAAWDDTYAFIQDVNEEYISSNLVDETFTGLRLNLMVYVNATGQVVYAKAYDLVEDRAVPMPTSLLKHLHKGAPLLAHNSTSSSLSGILLLPEGAMLVASRPILTSKDEGPIRGALIMGRYLTRAEVERISNITHLIIEVRRLDQPGLEEELQLALQHLPVEGEVFVQGLSESRLGGYAMLRDIYGRPGLLVKVSLPREVYGQGKRVVLYFMLFIVGAGFAYGLITLLLLERTIISRLAELSGDVEEIGEARELSARVRVSGDDEIAELGGRINSMLEALERSELERRRAGESMRLLATLMQRSGDAIVVLDREGRIMAWNAGAEKLYGYTQAEALKLGFIDLVPTEMRGVEREVWRRLARGEEVARRLASRLTKDGRVIEVQSSPSALVDDRGVVKAFVMVERRAG